MKHGEEKMSCKNIHIRLAKDYGRILAGQEEDDNEENADEEVVGSQIIFLAGRTLTCNGI